MPKPYTFPTLYNDLKTLCIPFLCKHGYLKPNNLQAGTVSWSRNGNNTGSISITVSTKSENAFIQFDYISNDIPINYRVKLVSMPSNLGKGLVWFFICPKTGKRCKKLHLYNSYFYHRTAFNGCMYQSQTLSKKARELDKIFSCYFKSENLYSELYKKHLKKKYAGKPTKKYLNLTQQIAKAESIPYYEIERALLS